FVATVSVDDGSGTPKTTTATITILRDTDGDGLPDNDPTEVDDDNDGIPDEEDKRPKVSTDTSVTAEDRTVVAGRDMQAIPITVTTDAKNPVVTVDETQLPEGVRFDPTTNQITGRPTGADLPNDVDEKAYTVTITVNDGTTTPATTTATITVQRDTDGDGVPDQTDPDKDGDGIPNELDLNPKTPKTTVITANGATVLEGDPMAEIPVSVDTDAKNPTFAAQNLPNGVTIDPNTGTISGIPELD
ncbi:hypothetical protein HO675_10540, partial [Streptococcus suis]|nr:hypothetical protein [Streptococcus suis]